MEYRTIEKYAFDEFSEKRSRFIGYARPVQTEEEAVAHIYAVRARHRDASHNCYAYVLRDGNTRRYSDDGEPKGTAGIPILETVLKENLTDVCVVATRYFGGVLLGAGGLVRAYGKTAKIAVVASGIIAMAKCAVVRVKCDYNMCNRLLPVIAAAGAAVKESEFLQDVSLCIHIRDEEFDRLSLAITEAANGRVRAEKTGEIFAKV